MAKIRLYGNDSQSTTSPASSGGRIRLYTDEDRTALDKTAAPPAPAIVPTVATPAPKPTTLQKVKDTVVRVGKNIAGLPKGIGTALNAPRDIQKQKKAEEDMLKEEKTFLNALTGQGVKDPAQRQAALIKFREKQGGLPNHLKDRNSRIDEEGYAKEVAGTFFDVATIPVGGARVGKAIVKGATKGAAKITAKEVLKTAATRAVEGAAYGGARATSQGEKAKDIAVQTAAGAVVGGVIGAVEKPAAKLVGKLLPKKQESPNLPVKVTDTPSPTQPKTEFRVPGEVDRFTKQRTDAKEMYRTIGMTSAAGKKPENAGLRIIESQFKTDQGRDVALQELDDQITKGRVKVNDDGTITVWRGGKVVDKNDLVSVSTSKEAAQEFGDVTEFRIQPDDVAVANGLDPDELLVSRKALKTELPATEKLAQAQAESSSAKQAEVVTSLESQTPQPKPAEVARQKLAEHVEGQRVQYEAAQNTLDLANDRLDGQVANLKLLIKNEERRKTGFDVTKISGLDEYTEMLRDATGDQNLTTSDLVDYIKALPSQKDVERLKPAELIKTPAGERKVAPKAAKPIKPVSSAGERLTPKLTERIADETGNEFGERYTRAELVENAKVAADLVENDLDRAIRIATGKEVAPNDVLGGSVYNAVKEYALVSGDTELLRDMVGFRKQATRFGQEIASLADVDPNDPVKAMHFVTKAREEALERKSGRKVSALVKETTDELKKIAKEALPTQEEWNNMLDEVIC